MSLRYGMGWEHKFVSCHQIDIKIFPFFSRGEKHLGKIFTERIKWALSYRYEKYQHLKLQEKEELRNNQRGGVGGRDHGI